MTTLINKESTQHYANKMVLAENRKVGSKSLPTALNEIDALIDEMKTYFDAEYGSALDMKLENNKNVFSVGTGTNIDKRSEVENSFTDVELSGNSLVNITHPLYPMHIKWTHEGTWQSKFIMYADAPNINTNSAHKKVMFNPRDKTTYTIVCNVIKNTSSGNVALHNAEKTTCMFKTHMHIKPSDVGILKFVQTADYSGLDMSRKDLVVLRTQSSGVASGEIEIADIMILEGDWTNKPLPQYFEGLKSIGEKEDGNHKISILSCNGGNIISNPRYKRGYYVDYRNGNEREEVNYSCTDYIEIEPNREIRVINTNFNIVFYDSNKNYIKRTLQDFIGSNTNFKTITPSNASYVRFSTPNEAIGTEGCFYGDSIGDINTEIRIDKKEISLNEPLRGLPNGTRDTIEKIDNEWKLIRRCGFRTITGDEHWTWSNSGQQQSEEIIAVYFIEAESKEYSVLLSDKQASLTKYEWDHFVREGIYRGSSGFGLTIRKNRLSDSSSLVSIKEWIKANKFDVIYELTQPIIEDIDPITLQCWKTGTISIDEVLPVETNHTVALNKSAQIKNNIKELTTLRKRVEDLESFYDKIALEQAYQLDLVNHSYELDYNR